jgi:peptidoglycan hydrolase-like protein with peptidoglycan-binding domain
MPRKKGKGKKSKASKAGSPGGPGKIPKDKNAPSSGKIPGDKKQPSPQKAPQDKKSPIPQKAPQDKKKPAPGKIPPDKETPEELQQQGVEEPPETPAEEKKPQEIIPEKEEEKPEELVPEEEKEEEKKEEPEEEKKEEGAEEEKKEEEPEKEEEKEEKAEEEKEQEEEPEKEEEEQEEAEKEEETKEEEKGEEEKEEEKPEEEKAEEEPEEEPEEEAEEEEAEKEPEKEEEEKSPVEEVKEEVAATWNKLKDLKGKFDDLKEKAAKYVPDEVKKIWEENQKKLEELNGGLLKKLKQAYEDAKNLCKDWEAAGGSVGDAMTAAEESWNTAQEAFDKAKEVLETVTGYIEDGTILNKLQETWDMVNEAKDKAVEAEEKGEEAWEKIQEACEHCEGVETFTITAPEADAAWGSGAEQHITWTTREGEEISNVKIELYKGEELVSTLVEETENNGDWGPWTVDRGDADAGEDFSIKITSTEDEEKSGQSQDFSIADNTLTVTGPASGDSWGIGSENNITWTSTGSIENVKIELWKGETLQSTLIEETANNGEWGPWTVADGGGGEGEDYRIKIISTADDTISAFSENFSIAQSTITVTSPGSDDSWTTGTAQNVTWTSTGPIENVKIELWKGESKLSTLISETPNNGEWGPWTVDDSGGGAGEDYRIKIVQADNPDISGFSENFAISETTITVTEPSSESDWMVGSENHITWEADEEIENVKIELWKGTSQLSTLIEETPNNGNWGPWEVDIRGEGAGADYRIKVINTDNPSSFGFSNNFTISEEEEEAPTEFAIAPNLLNTIVLEGLAPGEEKKKEKKKEIPPGEIRVIEIADVQFRTNSAVPSPLEQPAEQGGRVPALDAIRIAYLYAELNNEHQLLIAGHTDTTATARFNFELSAYRAKSIHALTRGDIEEWKEAVSAKNRVEDRQAILKYFHGYEGISSDPGPIDGIEGERTRNATRGFQRGYNRIFNEEITVDGVWGPQTWGAVFSFYEKLLDDSLGEDRESLGHYRGQLTWYSTRQMCACGESIPKDHPGADEYRSRTNRRVEILFLSPQAELEFTCCTEDGPFAEEVCDRDTCPLYGLNETGQPANNFTNITDEGLINTTNIKVFLRDVFGKPLADMGYTLRYLGGSREGSTDDQGMLMEEDVPEGEVRIELANGLYANFEDDDAGEDVLDTFGGEERPPTEGVES